MSQQTRRLSAQEGVIDEMPGVYTTGPQMFNELYNFPTGVELLGIPAAKDDGVAGLKLHTNSNWRVLNGQQIQHDYAGGFNSQKEGNINMQSLEAMQLYLLNPANAGDFSGPAISNGGMDHHQSSDHANSIQFQFPVFPQSMANQGLCNIEQVPSRDSWQSGGGVNELLLLPTGNGDNLLSNNIQFNAPPQQLSHTVSWANSALQPSTSQWCEQSPLETKFRSRDERSVQGLSLSLSSNSQVQVQPFETSRLISSQDMINRLQSNSNSKDKTMDILNGSKAALFSPFSRSDGMFSAKGYWNPNSGSSRQFEGLMKQSRYMKPTRRLLDEFCSVAGQGVKGNAYSVPKHNPQKSEQEIWFGGQNMSRSIVQSGQKVEPSVSISVTATGIICDERTNGNGNKDGIIFSGDRFELRRRKAKLLWMLDEVEKRYRQYCEQMKIVVAAFDSAAGVGAATTYTNLAAKAMSRHFKCLKDAIRCQIKATNDVLGEKESNVPGITKGETPRLKLIEQSLRQRRTYQQVGMFEHDAWRPQRGLPERAVTVLRAWLFEHFLHPYPSDADKHLLARQTGLSRSQVSNWFINARVRLWKPMVEEMYQEEAMEAEMEEGKKNSNPNKHEKHEVGATDSDRSSKDLNQDMPMAAIDSSGGTISVSAESQEQTFDCSSFKENLGKVEEAVEDNANKFHGANVGGVDFSSYNGNGNGNGTSSGNGSGNMFHQQNISSTYFGSGDVSLTLGLRHTGALSIPVADPEKYHNVLYLP